jgi:sugar phosphate isomerase/epimerase
MLGPDDLVLCAGSVNRTPLLDRLDPAARAGFAGISLFAGDCAALLDAGMTMAAIRRRIADAGLVVTDAEIIGRWCPGQTPPPHMPEWLAALLMRQTPEAILPAAAEMGATTVTVGELFGVPFDAEAMAEAFGAGCDLAATYGLKLALEFIPTGGVPSLAAGWEVVRRAGRANGGLLVDSWHLFRSGSTVAELAALPGTAIASVQISDAPATPSADLDHEMSHDRLLPGEGALDLVGFLRALDAAGSRVPIGVEVFSDPLFAEPIDVAARRLAETTRAVIARGRAQ